MTTLKSTGHMTEWLLWQKRTTFVDAHGQEQESWSKVDWIAAEPLRVEDASGPARADVRLDRYVRRWRTWWRDEFAVHDRVVDQYGRAYYVAAIVDPDGRRRIAEIEAEVIE